MTNARFISLHFVDKKIIGISIITCNPWNDYFIINIEYNKKTDSFYSLYKKLKNQNIRVKNKNDFENKFLQFKYKI